MDSINTEKLDKLLRLTNQVANRVLSSRATGCPISGAEAAALDEARHLLRDYEVICPDALTEALDQYDEVRASRNTSLRPGVKVETIRLPRVEALPRRLFSMLGLK